MSGPGFIAEDKFHEACELCGKVAELRPYGPNGEDVCFPSRMILAVLAGVCGAAACWRASARDRVGAVVFVIGYLAAILAGMWP